MTVPAPYNLTGSFSNMSGIIGLTQAVNTTLMYGFFGIMLLIAIFLISLSSFFRSTGDVSQSITSSLFIVFVLSLMLRAINLVPDMAVYALLALLAISVAALFRKD